MSNEGDRISLLDVIDELNKKLAATKAVMDRFPDAVEEIGYKRYPYFKAEESIAFDPDIKFDYSGVWQNLELNPYVMAFYVHNEQQHEARVSGWHYSIVKLSHPGLLTGNYLEQSLCTWGNFEDQMLKDGFTQYHINDIYKHYVLELTKNPNPDIKLVTESLPLKIRQLILFI
jgi:hypothetical protein